MTAIYLGRGQRRRRRSPWLVNTAEVVKHILAFVAFTFCLASLGFLAWVVAIALTARGR